MNTSRLPSASKAARASVPAASLAIALTGSLHAAEESASNEATKLSDIVVEGKKQPQISSPKFTEPLRDTPQTVVVIPNEIYSQQAAATLSDVLRNTPGITFAAGEGGNANATAGDSFYMRGYDATTNILVDGVRDVGAYSRDVFNVDSVEVVKGSSGSDIGRGGASGYVNLITKRPQQAAFVAGTVSYGLDEVTSGSQRRATFDVNQPLSDSPVKGTAVRLSAVAQDNDVASRKFTNTESWGIAPSLALGLGTPTRAFFSYQHDSQDSIPDYGLPYPAFPGYTSTPASPAIDWRKFYGFTADYDRVTHDAALARVEHDLSSTVTVSNQTRYSTVNREAVVTGPAQNPASYVPGTGLLTRTRQGNKRDTDIVSNLTNVTARLSLGKIEHAISTGLELARETAYQPAFVSALLTPIPVALPDPNSTPSGAPTRSGAYTDAHLDTAALYLFDTIKLTDRWQLNAGTRLDRYKIDYLSVGADGVRTTLIGRDTLQSWKGGLVYKPAPNGSIYVSYGLAFRPPGTDFALSTAINNQNNLDTAAQRTTNAELGTKWDLLGNRLQATAAIFQSRNSNTVFTDPVLGAIPVGSQTVKGVELGLSGRITADWLVFAGISYLDSVYNRGTAAQTGASLPLTPEWSGNVWTTYRLPKGFTVGGGAQYMGEASRLDTTTTVPRTMPSYWLVNAVASYEINERVTLRLNVSNLFDEHYVRSFNNNGGRFSPGAPRSYLMSAEFRF